MKKYIYIFYPSHLSNPITGILSNRNKKHLFLSIIWPWKVTLAFIVRAKNWK